MSTLLMHYWIHMWGFGKVWLYSIFIFSYKLYILVVDVHNLKVNGLGITHRKHLHHDWTQFQDKTLSYIKINVA